MGIERVAVGVATLVAALLLPGCGNDRPQAAPPTPTVTVTEEVSVETTVTATPSPRPVPTKTVTVTSSPSSPTASGTTSAPDDAHAAPAETDETFDQKSAKTAGSYIVKDMSEVEVRLKDGILVSSSLSFLSDSYADLQEAGVPPSADPALYTARLSTLSTFAADAADIWDSGDTRTATAKYEVIRQETGHVFGVLNRELGTNFRVPTR